MSAGTSARVLPAAGQRHRWPAAPVPEIEDHADRARRVQLPARTGDGRRGRRPLPRGAHGHRRRRHGRRRWGTPPPCSPTGPISDSSVWTAIRRPSTPWRPDWLPFGDRVRLSPGTLRPRRRRGRRGRRRGRVGDPLRPRCELAAVRRSRPRASVTATTVRSTCGWTPRARSPWTMS
ncbi:MAG: hypothetical protein U5R31_14085 [Acidimicrobiia bacterium]|nr:hypothetical protein [Acidimicrobiia bacterium]